MSTWKFYESNGGPAFAVPEPCEHAGMTLRDYFAGQAIAAILTNKEDLKASGVAAAAYQIADAMLRARAQGEDVHD